MPKCIILILFLTLLSLNLTAQTIEGVVSNTEQKKLAGVSIILTRKGNENVLAFSISQLDGKFQLSYNAVHRDSLELTVSMLGYESLRIDLGKDKRTNYEIVLKSKIIDLPELKVKVPPLWQRKDTINYNVSAFKQIQDKVIGDIIARLPGIEVASSGQIRYQGKPINKYYIEGMDLLDDRYGLANNNIPAESVENIQILENHQPVKVLDSIAFSDRAAINIKLKSSSKGRLLGRSKLAVGTVALISESEVTGMVFKKKQQQINTYKFNNTGQDNSKELVAQNAADYSTALRYGNIKNDLVSIVRPQVPGLKDYRYVFNRMHTASVNHLLPINRETNIRISLDYLNNQDRLQSVALTNYHYLSDTLNVSEKVTSLDRLQLFKANINITANTPRYFLKNDLNYQYWGSNAESSVYGTSDLRQNLSNPFQVVSNVFHLIKAREHKMYEWKSNIGSVSIPQSLLISPGIFKEVLNNGVPYSVLLQSVNGQKKYMDNSYAQRHKFGLLHVKGLLGASYQMRKLNSGLDAINGIQVNSVGENYQNEVRWTLAKLYAENEWSIIFKQLRISLNLPISFNKVQYKDTVTSVNSSSTPFFFTPSTHLVFSFSPRSTLQVIGARQQTFGDLDKFNRGFILRDYRTLISNNNPQFQVITSSVSSNYILKNTVKLIFFNTTVLLSRRHANMISDQNFKGALQIYLGKASDNQIDELMLNTRIGKYFTTLKTNLTTFFTFSNSINNAMQQGEQRNFKNNSIQGGLVCSSKLGSKLSFDYNNSFSATSVLSDINHTKFHVSSFNQMGVIHYYPKKQFGVRILAEHYKFKNSISNAVNYFFGDLVIQCSPSKSKANFEFGIYNFTNTTKYIEGSVYGFIKRVTEYNIRPRQALVKVSFSF